MPSREDRKGSQRDAAQATETQDTAAPWTDRLSDDDTDTSAHQETPTQIEIQVDGKALTRTVERTARAMDAGTATIKINADTSEFKSELASLSFWRWPSLAQVVQSVTLLAILWRVW